MSKIQALDIRVGDRIVAYCNNKRQLCKVGQVLASTQGNITLTVSTSGYYRKSASCRIQFQREALVDLAS